MTVWVPSAHNSGFLLFTLLLHSYHAPLVHIGNLQNPLSNSVRYSEYLRRRFFVRTDLLPRRLPYLGQSNWLWLGIA